MAGPRALAAGASRSRSGAGGLRSSPLAIEPPDRSMPGRAGAGADQPFPNPTCCTLTSAGRGRGCGPKPEETCDMLYPQPGGEGSPITHQEPLRQLHRGRVGPAGERPLLREPVTGERQDVLRGGAGHRRRHRPGPRRGPRRQGCVGAHEPRRTLRDPAADRAAHRGEPRGDRRRRGVGERQVGARVPRGRHPAGGRPLPLLRRRAPGRGGLDHPDRRHDRGLPLQGAARAWSARSSRGTSRSSWRCGSWLRPWPPATASCSSRPSRRRCRSSTSSS